MVSKAMSGVKSPVLPVKKETDRFEGGKKKKQKQKGGGGERKKGEVGQKEEC